MVVAIAAVSFASCGGNKAADAAKENAESIRVADSLKAVEAAAAEAQQVAETDTTATEGEQAKTEAEAK
ncbi:secreted protein [gut metagenome]|uniref:Secreted protein n=1 Tax=gut metagenome TaxID=749906 RepID=J9DCJ1_9ZZZZ